KDLLSNSQAKLLANQHINSVPCFLMSDVCDILNYDVDDPELDVIREEIWLYFYTSVLPKTTVTIHLSNYYHLKDNDCKHVKNLQKKSKEQQSSRTTTTTTASATQPQTSLIYIITSNGTTSISPSSSSTRSPTKTKSKRAVDTTTVPPAKRDLDESGIDENSETIKTEKIEEDENEDDQCDSTEKIKVKVELTTHVAMHVAIVMDSGDGVTHTVPIYETCINNITADSKALAIFTAGQHRYQFEIINFHDIGTVINDHIDLTMPPNPSATFEVIDNYYHRTQWNDPLDFSLTPAYVKHLTYCLKKHSNSTST
ncbi:unnamed protein product, partial [Didymodactylos carnosus]